MDPRYVADLEKMCRQAFVANGSPANSAPSGARHASRAQRRLQTRQLRRDMLAPHPSEGVGGAIGRRRGRWLRCPCRRSCGNAVRRRLPDAGGCPIALSRNWAANRGGWGNPGNVNNPRGSLHHAHGAVDVVEGHSACGESPRLPELFELYDCAVRHTGRELREVLRTQEVVADATIRADHASAPIDIAVGRQHLGQTRRDLDHLFFPIPVRPQVRPMLSTSGGIYCDGRRSAAEEPHTVLRQILQCEDIGILRLLRHFPQHLDLTIEVVVPGPAPHHERLVP
mmetsp:Transcript_23482/g.67969  ORF Transcript_23482/g.67969 Transcript_23482/m.67969 type:complete len:283 (+) Transcript_23482:336-1184(+)